MRWVGSGSVTELISVDETLKMHCNLVGISAYDTLLTSYIKTAGILIERKVGYPLRYTAATVYYHTKAECIIKLPFNVSSVTEYAYLDSDEWVVDTFTESVKVDYNLHSEVRSLEIKHNTDYKMTCVVSVNNDELIKDACRMLVTRMFEQREIQDYKTTGGSTNYDNTLDFYLQGHIAVIL